MYNVICKSRIINAKYTTYTWIYILSLNKYQVSQNIRRKVYDYGYDL